MSKDRVPPLMPPLIVHIIYALGTGGLENGLVNIINRSPVDRYRHAIVCLTHATDFAKRITAPNVTVVELHKKPGHDLGVYWRLLKTLNKLRPSIVHTRNLAALEMQFLTLLFPRVKRVHGEHGRDIYDIDGSNAKYNALRKVTGRIVHRYIAVSKDLQAWLLNIVGIADVKVMQIYNGVDQMLFFPAAELIDTDLINIGRSDITPSETRASRDILPAGFATEQCLIIGTVGRIAEIKDQITLVKAFDALLRQQPAGHDHLRLVIVGDGPVFAHLQHSVESLGLQARVWLTGDRKDIPELLRAMDLFALPSLGEGISNTVLEAMATALPVVATHVGGNPELVDNHHTGILVPVSDANALAGALSELVNDAAMLSRYGKNGLDKVKGLFCWDNTVANYLSVYDELLD